MPSFTPERGAWLWARATPGVEPIAQAVPEEVRGQDDPGDRDPGDQHHPLGARQDAAPLVEERAFPIAAVAGDTPVAPRGVFVLPGTYQVRLSVGGQSFRQAVTVRQDPRVKTPLADLGVQMKLSRAVDYMLRRLAEARADVAARLTAAGVDDAAALRARMTELQTASGDLVESFEVLQEADVKPTPAVEAAVAAALARADAMLAGKALAPQ